jgi:glycosyltransferase involved in cell wall biosynthesis
LKTKKVLFIAAHRKDRSPSQRFRFEQYFSFLEQNGYECELSYLISEKDDASFYKPGKYVSKIKILLKSVSKRFNDIARASRYNIIFIQREAFMTGTIFFEKMLSKSKAKVIFDFDDSIWLQDISPVNQKLTWLKDASKTSEIIKLADMVFAGNQYLANYALKFNKNVSIVPTTIDTEVYKPLKKKESAKITIGWSGSFSTIKHFEVAIPFLKEISKKYPGQIEIVVIGDGNYVNDELKLKGIAWNKKDEIAVLSSFDIGIMPLPDDEWANGKCGLKGLQYMALEVPTIMSPVGVNTEIIEDGENGLLARSREEWIEKISLLVESSELRRKLGQNGRETVLKKYSVYSQKDNYLKLFNHVVSVD